MARLTSLGTSSDWSHSSRSVRALLAEAIEPYAEGDIDVHVEVGERDGAEPVDRRNPAILYGIGNLIENAVDFAKSKVEIRVSWTAEHVVIEIVDDGPGFAPEIIDRIGEPYVTTRGHRGKPEERPTPRPAASGSASSSPRRF